MEEDFPPIPFLSKEDAKKKNSISPFEAILTEPPLHIRLLYVAFLGPIAEELVFRGLLFPFFHSVTGFLTRNSSNMDAAWQ